MRFLAAVNGVLGGSFSVCGVEYLSGEYRFDTEFSLIQEVYLNCC